MTDPVQPLASGSTRARVEWIDTDAAGIYHNSAVIRFVEAAEAAMMRSRGLDGYFPAAPRVRFEVDFLAPLFFGQEVTTTVRVTRIGSTSMTFGFEVRGEEHAGRPAYAAARGSYVTVHLDRSTGGHEDGVASSPWPPDWITRLHSP